MQQRRLILIKLLGLGFVAGTLAADEAVSQSLVPDNAPNISLQLELQRSIDRGIRWLVENQREDGSWSDADHPAVTSLALVALQRDPVETHADLKRPALELGYRFVVESVQDDGGIYRIPALQNYNTSVSIMALVAADNPEYHSIIRRARDHVIGWQSDFGEPGKIDTTLDGGIGYGGTYPHSDMSNTVLALEALYYSKHLVTDQTVDKHKDLNWEAVIHFVQGSQNLPETNPASWVSGDPANRGGFVYFPGNSKAGEVKSADGRTSLRSYGSISYAGLLSFIYADLNLDDPRIKAVLEWLENNFTLEENPAMGPQGLFYYYHTMTKALTLAGVDSLTKKDGSTIDWRKQLALKLLDLQKEDGSWSNTNGRWWEKDSALVTAYVVLSLEMLYSGL